MQHSVYNNHNKLIITYNKLKVTEDVTLELPTTAEIFLVDMTRENFE